MPSVDAFADLVFNGIGQCGDVETHSLIHMTENLVDHDFKLRDLQRS